MPGWFTRTGARLDAYFAPVLGATRGEVSGREWARILKVALVSAAVGFATMVASEYHDHPDELSRDPMVSAIVVGLTGLLLSYLHRKQDGAPGESPRGPDRP